MTSAAARDAPGRARLVKLVRDNVDRFVIAGDGVSYHPIPDREDLLAALRAKLIEEATEYLTDPTRGEAADVLEVLRALAHHASLALDLVPGGSQIAKFAERGGFIAGTGMYVISSAPLRHEGRHAQHARAA